MSVFEAAQRARSGLGLVLLLSGLPWLGACGGARIGFPYPREGAGFDFGGSGAPRVFLGRFQDLRPPEQRDGRGHFFTIAFPGDPALERPAEQLYREALAQDLAETRVAELVPAASQAEYVLSAEIFSLGCRLERPPASFLLPPAAGMMGGLAFGKTSSDRIKTGVAIGLGLMLAVPMPAQLHAETEVRLTLRDRGGDVAWQQTCRGEVGERVYLPVTARDDRKLAQRYLPRAVKRCDACLLGQLERYLSGRAGAPPK